MQITDTERRLLDAVHRDQDIREKVLVILGVPESHGASPETQPEMPQ